MPNWTDSEPGLRAAFFHAMRLLRRAASRPLRCVAVALGFALMLTTGKWLKGDEFAPPFVLRVSETDRDPSLAPRADGQLREHVLAAVFTDGNLRKIMERHDVQTSLLESNPRAALDSMREDISVSVHRNYFVEERSARQAPRTARISIAYQSPDPYLATAVTKDLGHLVIEHEREARHRVAALAENQAKKTVKLARTHLEERQRRIAEHLAGPRSPVALVELGTLLSSFRRLRLDLESAEGRLTALSIGTLLESQGMGLHFEVVEEPVVPTGEITTRSDLFVLGLVTFLMGLPLAALGVGAFTRRIDEMEDLAMLGLRPIGRIRVASEPAR